MEYTDSCFQNEHISWYVNGLLCRTKSCQNLDPILDYYSILDAQPYIHIYTCSLYLVYILAHLAHHIYAQPYHMNNSHNLSVKWIERKKPNPSWFYH